MGQPESKKKERKKEGRKIAESFEKSAQFKQMKWQAMKEKKEGRMASFSLLFFFTSRSSYSLPHPPIQKMDIGQEEKGKWEDSGTENMSAIDWGVGFLLLWVCMYVW